MSERYRMLVYRNGKRDGYVALAHALGGLRTTSNREAAYICSGASAVVIGRKNAAKVVDELPAQPMAGLLIVLEKVAE